MSRRKRDLPIKKRIFWISVSPGNIHVPDLRKNLAGRGGLEIYILFIDLTLTKYYKILEEIRENEYAIATSFRNENWGDGQIIPSPRSICM